MGPILSRDDLDQLSETAAGAEDPAAVAAALVDAVAAGRLADPADAGYAYLLAAEIQERAEDLPAALALAERALTAYRRDGVVDLSQPRGYRARLLLQLGREDEGMAELTELRPLLEADPFEAEPVAGGDAGGFQAAAGEVDGDPVDDPADPYDFDDAGADEVEAVLLVWPKESYEQVDQRWPEVLEPTGAESWEEYRRYCQGVIATWPARGRAPLALALGDADGFDEWLAEQGVDPYQANLVALARGYGDYLAEQGDLLEMPPGRDDPCWCGSKLSYGRCCQRLPG